MEDRSHALIALAFLIVFGIGSVALFMTMTHHKKEDRYYEIVTSQNVGGVQPQAGVYFKGLPVGTVKSIHFDPQNPRKVVILFAVYHDAYISHATYATLSFAGLTGMSNIDLHLDPTLPDTPLPTSRKHPAKIPLRQGMLASLEKSGKGLINRLNSILDRADDLLNNNNRQQISQLLAHLNKASAKLTTLETQLEPTLKKLPALSNQISEVLASTKRLEARAGTTLNAATKTANSITRLSETGQQTLQGAKQLEPQLATTVQQLNTTLREIDQLTRKLDSQPQSLIFGPPPQRPGPGEPGFHPPQEH